MHTPFQGKVYLSSKSKFMHKIIMLSLVSFFLSHGTLAQGPPITVQTPVMLGLAGSGIRSFGKYIVKENASIYIQPLGVPFNISPKFQIGAIVPYRRIAPKKLATVGGIGDVRFFSKFQLYKKDRKAETFRILAHFSQSFPTGKSSSVPQIGSGLYQSYVGFILGSISSAVGIYADFGYNMTSSGADDNFLYNFSLGIPLLEHKYPQNQINLFLEFNGNYIIAPEVHSLFISPGIQYIPGRRILFETNLQLPLIQTNVSSNKTRYMFSLGTRFLLT